MYRRAPAAQPKSGIPVLRPAGDAHSIKAVAFVCEFDREISNDALDFFLEESKRFRSKFAIRQPVRSFALEFPSSAGFMSQTEVRGYRFLTKAPDDTEKFWFEVTANRAVYCTTEYYSLEAFLADALLFIECACRAHEKSGSSAIRVALEYRDEFDSDSIDWDPSDALNLDSRYIVPAAPIKGEFWHSHCGLFTSSDFGKILNNIRIEHVALQSPEIEAAPYKLVVLLTHTLNLNRPIEATEITKDSLNDYLIALRKSHKSIFSDVISKNMLKLVKFN